eukprot:69893_1
MKAELTHRHLELKNKTNFEESVQNWDYSKQSYLRSHRFDLSCVFPYTSRPKYSGNMQVRLTHIYEHKPCMFRLSSNIRCDSLCNLHPKQVYSGQYIFHENCMTSSNVDGSMNVDKPHDCSISCGALYRENTVTGITRSCNNDGYYVLNGCEEWKTPTVTYDTEKGSVLVQWPPAHGEPTG